MANLITTTKTYATVMNAEKALDKACEKMGCDRAKLRYLIAVSPDGKRFVPTVVGVNGPNGISNVGFAHLGVMVVA